MKNEDNNIEYKRDLNNKLKREIVAFLNSTGGYIYLGVDDETKKILEIPDTLKHEWEETLNHWYTNAFYPTPFGLIDIDVNHTPFLIRISQGRHKPYSISQNGLSSTGVYIRYGSSSVKATNEEVKRMIQQNVENGEFDSEESPDQKLTFNTLENRAKTVNIPFNIKALRMLKNDNLYNNSALLVSDQNPNVIKAAIYQGNTVLKFLDKHEFLGSLVEQISDVINYINLQNHTKININGDPQRKETFDYPKIAIREAIVNAFAHRDYLLHSTIKIEIFDNRIEILSPGGIADGLTLEEIESGMTAVRNPQLVHILDKLGYIENYGTGIRRMFEAYREYDKNPIFKVHPNSFTVILPNVNYVEKAIIVGKHKGEDEKELIINLLSVNGAMKKSAIQSELKLTDYNTRKLLNTLIAQQKVVKIGKSINTRYQINE